MARFLVQRHSTGRSHFDLRLIWNDCVRSWSLLKEPPAQTGERRLAIEREQIGISDLDRRYVEEEAFGTGKVRIWDGGEVEIKTVSESRLMLIFAGGKMKGRYELRRMSWYPGNRWMLEKSDPGDANLT